MRMMREPFFSDKKILVIDNSLKTENDRTWCFWEKDNDIFEPVVHHSWNQLRVFSNDALSHLTISPYAYKMIRGIELYKLVRKTAMDHPNIEWKQETVLSLRSDKGKAFVELASGVFSADYVFNSILFEMPAIPAGKHFLWQHFMGWMIKTKENAFDNQVATLMDFRIPQDNGTAFMYVLPTSSNTALVEYTLFSKTLLPANEYEKHLKEYCCSVLQIAAYEILHTEYGKIPMTNIVFPAQKGRIIYMGTAGGQIKPSSGYAFQFIQKHTKQLVASIVTKGYPAVNIPGKKFRFYDNVLLNVLANERIPGSEIFTRLFKRNKPEKLLRFLDNETSILEDLSIIGSLPTAPFLAAALQELKGN